MADVSRKTAMLLKCWECMGYYLDGKDDCGVTSCPLYTWMPYREKVPNTEVFSFSPKHMGKRTVEETRRELSDEHREKLRNRFKDIKNGGSSDDADVTEENE